jgi:hypothetical protein
MLGRGAERKIFHRFLLDSTRTPIRVQEAQ